MVVEAAAEQEVLEAIMMLLEEIEMVGLVQHQHYLMQWVLLHLQDN
jgi:hypothetical protein